MRYAVALALVTACGDNRKLIDAQPIDASPPACTTAPATTTAACSSSALTVTSTSAPATAAGAAIRTSGRRTSPTYWARSCASTSTTPTPEGHTRSRQTTRSVTRCSCAGSATPGG